MGKETILYYVTKESVTGQKDAEESSFWKRIRGSRFFDSFVAEDEENIIITVLVPMKQKEWRKEKLLRLMQSSVTRQPLYLGDVEVVIHPEIQQTLAQTEEFPQVFWSISEKLLTQKLHIQKPHTEYGTKKRLSAYRGFVAESVVLLLSDSVFPEEQIRRFSEMMQPYFPGINHLTILYEPDLDDKEDDDTEAKMPAEIWQGGDRWKETLEDYADELYYEYGLVCQIQQSGKFSFKKQSLFLDYGYGGALPLRALQEGGVYLDVASSDKKEMLIRQKCTGTSYLSPRKYLDTVVKSGYDNVRRKDKTRNISITEEK